MREVDELRQLTAGRLLEIWRENGREEPVERALLCNGQVLAESCFFQGEAAFAGREDVLETLTPREMETLIGALAAGGAPTAGGENPAFDRQRFLELKGK